ncbi:putative Secreted protein [Pseudomonas brassicacearum]
MFDSTYCCCFVRPNLGGGGPWEPRMETARALRQSTMTDNRTLISLTNLPTDSKIRTKPLIFIMIWPVYDSPLATFIF